MRENVGVLFRAEMMSSIPGTNTPTRRYVLISPCRNEAAFLRQTLESVITQTVRPALWVVVDDGSSDETPDLLADNAKRHPWIRIVNKTDRGHRAVGPGVVEAFNVGLSHIELSEFDYVCKLDLDLNLPSSYFEGLMERMETSPRMGSCSGKPYYRTPSGELRSEKCGDEMSVGMTKFYRVSCFKEIGGFVPEVMWDAIDCHRSRQLGWTVASWDAPDLRFEHLRPMGSSEKGILTGRMRHGFGQYFMGSDPLYFFATAVYRMAHPPFGIGGAAMLWGYASAAFKRSPRYHDAKLRGFVRHFQRRALRVGKARAIAEIERANEHVWSGGGPQNGNG